MLGAKFVNLNENPPTTHLSNKLNHNTLGKSRENSLISLPKSQPHRLLGILTFHCRVFQLGGSNHFCPGWLLLPLPIHI